MKNGLIIAACLGSLLFLILFVAVQKSYGTENQENNTAVVPFDVSDQTPIETEVAYAEKLEVPELVTYFKNTSIKKGAAYAYEILRRLPPSDLDPYKHLLGHVIGDELFNEQNIAGLKVCTSEFTSACYHSVIARAIDEQGLENIREINQKCQELKNSAGCLHGMGHGITAALGYEDPVSAANVCASLQKYGTTRACVEGVIMEFNFHQLEEISPTSARAVDERGYYYPCTDMPDTYKNECFFEQSLWWRELLGRSNFAAIGELCDAVENDENREWCYRGIGRLIPEFSSDPVEDMAAECSAATSAVQGQALCLQVLKEWTGNDGSICGLVDNEHRDICNSPMPEILD